MRFRIPGLIKLGVLLLLLVGTWLSGYSARSMGKPNPDTRLILQTSESIVSNAAGPNQGSPFVTRSGSQLILRNKPYYFVGVNRYNLLTEQSRTHYRGCGAPWTKDDLEDYFEELENLGVNVVRFWAFQRFTDSGKYFERFDFIITLAAKHNIKLIPVFENQWVECTTIPKTPHWYKEGYWSKYGDYQMNFRDYIHWVASRYKNRPEILFWQVINEPESVYTNGQPDPEALYWFAKDTSQLLKNAAPNHLVSFGSIGLDEPGLHKEWYSKLHAIDTIDVLEYHDYKERESMPPYLKRRLVTAVDLKKPIFVGEAGIALDCLLCLSKTDRAQQFREKMTAFFQGGGTGYLIWHYRDNSGITDEHAFTKRDPLADVVREISAQLSIRPLLRQDVR